ncbi:hypothetical protein D9758_001137 [Tetrapyrgos nigripes]|uniref:Zn(2)-C6 fungal-type domain-containing protein n=1 Tax=Tetrapyrgos nigripes TaxID=182062 RepID=A0A8H5GS71_9AGAR|nr:hypothetical protein D9758_001137 [Tetrapyrgos nigripes]
MSSQQSSFLPTRRRRAQIACRNCRKRKIRCVTNEEPPHDPCERCTRMSLVCEYVAVGEPSPPPTPTPGSGFPNAGSSYGNNQGPVYDPQHSRHSSATHAPYHSHSTEGMSRSQTHPSNTLYPTQDSISNQFWSNSPWPDQDVKPSISDSLRGMPSAPGYPTGNTSYFPHNQPGSVGNTLVQGTWPNSVTHHISRTGYENYPGMLQNPPRMNTPSTGQTFGSVSDRYTSYGIIFAQRVSETPACVPVVEHFASGGIHKTRRLRLAGQPTLFTRGQWLISVFYAQFQPLFALSPSNLTSRKDLISPASLDQFM